MPFPSALAAWRFRLVLALVLVASMMLAGIGAGYWYIHAKWANANKVALQVDPGPTANFLVLGSDSREFVTTEEDAASFGDVGGRRADTIFVVRVDPNGRQALLVSFPRDLWVEIPGKGNAKINSAFSDGPQLVIDTIRANFDIPIHHYVEVDFSGFRNIVDAMGGVEMYVAAPARDARTGLDIPDGGCVTLNGDQALAWVRSRHYQYFESGTWRNDPTGDFGRIGRQQDFMRRLIAQALESGVRNPIRGDDLIDTGLENLTVDEALDVDDVFKLVSVFRSGDPDDVEMLTVPAVVGRRGRASVVLPTDDAEAVFERLRGTAPEDGEVVASSVTVRVLNGTGAPGIATRTSRRLSEVGFQPGGVGDTENFGYDRTEIRYRPDAEAKARLVQRHVGGVGRLIEDDTIGAVDVVLIVGADFGGVVDAAGDEVASGVSVAPIDPVPIAAVRPAGTGQTEAGDDVGEGEDAPPTEEPAC